MCVAGVDIPGQTLDQQLGPFGVILGKIGFLDG